MIVVNPDSPAEKVFHYVSMVYRQRWPLLVCLVLGGVIAAAVAYCLPKQYESAITFMVEGQAIPDPFEERASARALERSVEERIRIINHIILSRSFLEDIIDKSDLRYYADTPGEREQLIGELRKSIDIQRKDANVISIICRGDSPKKTAKVANIILIQYEETINRMFGDKLKGVIYFLEEEREAYREQLAQAAQDLAKFKTDHMEVLPGSEGGHLRRLVDLESQRMNVELSILGKRRELEFLEEQLKRMEPYIREQTTVNQTSEVQYQTRLIETLEAKLQELLLRRTDKAPEVISLRNRINEAKAKLTEMKEKGTTEVSSELMVRNPVLIEQENARAKLELEIMGLEARKESLDDQIAELNTAVQTIPDQERLLQEKMTDYEVQKQNYLLLLREEHAQRLSKSMADHGQGAKFVLLDKPVENWIPVFPSIPLVIGLGLGVGLAIGAVIGLLREWLNQTVRSAEEVRAMLALPVLATVPSLGYTGEEAARVSDHERRERYDG